MNPNRSEQEQAAMEPNPSTSTKNPTMDQYGEALLQRMKTDTCFSCKNQGHWARDCPLKTPTSYTKSSTPGNVPVVQCPCGAGACSIRTHKYLNRQFYKCPLWRCDLSEFCDEVKAPMCPCGAGRCTVILQTIPGDPRPRRYFVCRVKKGHGACKFSQDEDSYLRENLAARDCGNTGEALPDRMEIELPEISKAEDSPKLANIHQDSGLEELLLYGSRKLDEMLLKSSPALYEKSPEMESDDRSLSPQSIITEEDELSVEKADLLDNVIQRARTVSLADCQARQRKFKMQIDAAGQELNGGLFPSFSVAPSSESESRNPLSLCSKQTDEQHIGHFAGHSPSRNSTPCYFNTSMLEKSDAVARVNYTAILEDAVMNIQNKFISRLDSIDPWDLKDRANDCFQLIKGIYADYPDEEFESRVRSYIDSALTLYRINADPTFQELLDRHTREKRKYEEVSGLHAEKTNEHKAKEDKVKELSAEATQVREMLSRIEGELSKAKEETQECEQCLVEMNQQKKRAKVSMNVTTQDFQEVSRQREVKRAAAEEAMHNARALLG